MLPLTIPPLQNAAGRLSTLQQLCVLDSHFHLPPIRRSETEAALLLDVVISLPSRRKKKEEGLRQEYREDDATSQPESQSPMSLEQFLLWTYDDDLEEAIDDRTDSPSQFDIDPERFAFLADLTRIHRRDHFHVSTLFLKYCIPRIISQARSWSVFNIHPHSSHWTSHLVFDGTAAEEDGEEKEEETQKIRRALARTVNRFADESWIGGIMLKGFDDKFFEPHGLEHSRIRAEEEHRFELGFCWVTEDEEHLVYMPPEVSISTTIASRERELDTDDSYIILYRSRRVSKRGIKGRTSCR